LCLFHTNLWKTNFAQLLLPYHDPWSLWCEFKFNLLQIFPLTTNFKQNQIILICTSMVSELIKKFKNKNKIYLFFLFFGQIQLPFLLLEQWNVVGHHPPKFFKLFYFFQSFFFNTTTFFLSVVFFGMKTCLGIYYKFKSLSTCENWCFNIPLFAPPSNSPPFRALE